MKAIVDNKIPYIKGQVEQLVQSIVYLQGDQITHEDVLDADILIIRTRTRCDSQLLDGTKVKLIVTATIGYDHIDTEYCESHGIGWTNCPGCNANSVCQYVHNALLITRHLEKGMKIGVVGVGHVGSLVAQDSEENGLELLLNDPPLEENGHFAFADNNSSTSLDIPFATIETIASEADIITFHTPLTRKGKHPTYHLVDDAFFSKLKRRPLIVNASRGEVVDNKALLRAIESGKVCGAVVDTWEGEPDINLDLLHKAIIATPHIAGYSADGKANATRMALMAVANFVAKDFNPEITLPEGETLSTETLLLDSTQLKANPQGFESMRSNYPIRRENNKDKNTIKLQYIIKK